ncbi:MAG: type II toxin-antitoxin system HicB family antitoxin [Treponema sp.]|nr:type II toxin-antitoxin system HicB family antitoxin [Treponema sp.]
MELGYTYWKDDGWYVGFLDDYPDYTTQGETFAEFEEMLRSLHEDIKTYDFSFIRSHGYLKIA